MGIHTVLGEPIMSTETLLSPETVSVAAVDHALESAGMENGSAIGSTIDAGGGWQVW